MTSRELVYATLEFRNSGRVPADLWVLPWVNIHYKEELSKLKSDYCWDFASVPGFYKESIPTSGDAHKVGKFVDEWNCTFENIHEGIIGEVKEPVIADWSDTSKVRIPFECLSIDKEKVNQWCKENDKFVFANCCSRPFERMQFLRGTENFFVDLALDDEDALKMLAQVHEFYCQELEVWGQTDVDGLRFMDDWGAQKSLLISPSKWREIFKPLYRDYVNIAKKYGKKIFMHSDGYILDIYPDLIEIGVDALNSQIFCMGLDKLEEFAGKITFWGEIDRQYLLTRGSVEEISNAVAEVFKKLSRQGGVIAQCEFGPGSTPERIQAVYDTWLKQ